MRAYCSASSDVSVLTVAVSISLELKLGDSISTNAMHIPDSYLRLIIFGVKMINSRFIAGYLENNNDVLKLVLTVRWSSLASTLNIGRRPVGLGLNVFTHRIPYS